MLKLVILVAAGFLLYKLFMGDKKKKMEKSRQETDERVEAGDMVQDPVCGTYVSADSRIRVKDGKQVYRFCSFECRDAYLERKKSGSEPS
jgi:YHS domain-containing protein